MERMTVKGVGRIDPALPALPAGDARQEAFERVLAAQVGKSMPVAVLSRLTDGSYLVRVADQHARMALPPGTAPGSELPMTLVSTTPRPAFQLNGQAQLLHPTLVDQELGELRTSGAAPLGAARPAAPSGEHPQGAGPRTALVALSDAGRTIARILGAASGPAGAAPFITATAPLAAAGSPEPARLAQALEGTLAQSGLFYESHVAEWAEGKRALPELLREPQMQKTLAAGARPAATELDPAAAQLVNQQLSAHEQGRVVWQGQVWPGQHMQWEIHKDAPERRGGDSEPGEPSWRSGLRLRFPMLGEIAATIVIAGDQLHIQLKTGTSEAQALLRTRSAELAAALGAAGNPLASLDIRATEEGNDG